MKEEHKRFIGKYAYGIYPAPAITCEMNGRLISREGTITGVSKDGLGREGVVIDGTIFQLSEIKCPTLKWTGSAYIARSEALAVNREAREAKLAERKASEQT